jgi:hypothetical protein
MANRSIRALKISPCGPSALPSWRLPSRPCHSPSRGDRFDLDGSRLFVAQSINRKGELGQVKTESSVRTVPLAGYLTPLLKVWKLACPVSPAG